MYIYCPTWCFYRVTFNRKIIMKYGQIQLLKCICFFYFVCRSSYKRLVIDEQSFADRHNMFSLRFHGEDRGAKTYG